MTKIKVELRILNKLRVIQAEIGINPKQVGKAYTTEETLDCLISIYTGGLSMEQRRTIYDKLREVE